MNFSIETKPRRSGTHPIFEVYVGGDALTSDYKITSPHSYSSTSQIRSEHSLNIAETSLHDLRSNTTSLKFNGKLDVTEGDPLTLSELSMEAFLRSVADIIERFDLEIFFYLPDYDKNMRYLLEEPHNFTLASVLAEHNSRITESDIIDEKGSENPALTAARFRCYDAYELCDFLLSQLAIENLIHPDLRTEVLVQHNHMLSFKKLPGKCIS